MGAKLTLLSTQMVTDNKPESCRILLRQRVVKIPHGKNALRQQAPARKTARNQGNG
jgi:hypothetical protein